ncbi:MAG: c-type heme family protein [Desulfobulbales bacterium]
MKSIGLKLFVIVGVFVLLFSAFLFYRTYLVSNNHAQQLVNQQADLALQFDLEIRNYVRDHIRPVMYEFVGEDEFIPETMSTSFVARAVFEETKKKFPGIVLKFSSDNPRNPANQASHEELEIIKFFNDNPDEKLWQGNISMNGKIYFAKFNARRMEDSCLRCHGVPEDAPQSLIDRYGSVAGFHRPVGEVIAMDTVAIPLSTIQEHLWHELKTNFTLIGAALIFLLAALFIAVRFFITLRLSNIASHFEIASTTKNFKQFNLLDVHGNDEISGLAKSFNTLASQLQEYHNSLENEIKERKQANLLLQEEVMEHQRTEDELVQSKAALESVLNNSNAICITSLDYEILMANDAYFSVFKDSPDPAVPIKCYDSRPGNLCHTDECPVRQVLGGKEFISNEVLKVHPGGEKINYIVTARPFLNAEGECIGIIENFQDISQVKEYETALSAEKERLAVTLNSIGDGVISTTTEGIVVMLNKVAQSLTGWRQEEASGKKLDEVFHVIDAKSREPKDDFVREVVESKQVVEFTDNIILIDREGREYRVEDSAAPIFDRSSEILGVVVVFRDVTGEKNLQEELERARKIESIGVLAGGIAHDFNNILTAITGNISLAKMNVEPESNIHTRLVEAEKACIRATGLTQQLITFSKGGAPIMQTASISDLLKDSATFVLRGSNVKCNFSIPEDLHPCEVDTGQIAQVLNNIIINADQAMPEGGIINVSAENITVTEGEGLPLKSGEYIRISIKDRGHGIAAEDIPKIFDPYFTTKKKGSGLGLASSYSIINKHAGFIGVESTVGEGSTFSIYLPASPAILAAKKTPTVETPVSGEGKVLIMDDEEAVRMTVKEMLRHLGYEVDTSVDGTEAIAMYKAAMAAGSPYAAVILDLTIPGGMGGRETIKKLKEIAPDVNAIVSSGYSNDPVMAEYAKYGFSGIIIKPYRISEISEVLQRTISAKTGK